MRSISRKRLLLFGFLAVLLLAIPLTVYLVQQQQETQSGATAATNLQLCPPDEPNCPPLQAPFTNKFTQTVKQGDDVQIAVKVNPNENAVTWIKFLVKYDPQKLSLKTDDGGEIIAFESNAGSQFIVTPNFPVYDPDLGTVSVEMEINALNPGITGGVQTLGTLNFIAEEATVTEADPAAFTSVSFDMTSGNTDARSSSEAEAKEPVIQNAIGTDVIIEASGEEEPTVSLSPSATLSPTEGDEEDTDEEGGDTNQAPVCESFTVDEAEGDAPLSVTYTTEGFDPDGIVSKVTFNFGDGPAQDLEETGGIGEASVSAQISHTYNTSGNFTATATFTDDNDATSDPNTCSKAISVGGAATLTLTPTPEPTLPATGPDKTVVGVGLLGAILTVLGFVIFFAL